jgi:hypothetical protein
MGRLEPGSSGSIVSDYGLDDLPPSSLMIILHGSISQKTTLNSSLMMEAVRTSETSVDNHFSRQYIPEDNSEHLL